MYPTLHVRRNRDDLRTCGEREPHLAFDDLQGDEVVKFVKATIVEQKTVTLLSRKTENRQM